jgi:hypothetical protein
MADPAVQAVREWLLKQPFALRFLTLLLFMVEAVEAEFGKVIARAFEDDLREACRKLPSPEPVQARRHVDGAETIADLPEDSQQAARKCIDNLRTAIKLYSEYMTRYLEADTTIGKTAGALGIICTNLEDTARELTKLHTRDNGQRPKPVN